MSRLDTWLGDLDRAGETAAAAEDSYRRDFARRVAELAETRAVAFRRANLVRAVAAAVGGAEDEQAAVAHGLAALRARLGWSSDSEARSEILSRFAPVCTAMLAAAEDGAEAPPPPSLGPSPSPASQGRIEGSTVAARSLPRAGEGDEAEPGGGGAPSDPAAALAAFESWYREAKGSSFWILFENVMPETPLVDW